MIILRDLSLFTTLKESRNIAILVGQIGAGWYCRGIENLGKDQAFGSLRVSSFVPGCPDGWCLSRSRKIGSCRRSGQAAARAQEPRRQPGSNQDLVKTRKKGITFTCGLHVREELKAPSQRLAL